jgi:transposase
MRPKQHRKHRPWSKRWEYDLGANRYTLHAEQLANLTIGQDMNRKAAAERRNTISRLLAQGCSVADMVLIIGLSRAAIYRHLIKMGRKPPETSKASGRSAAALAMLAAGKSTRETAQALGLSQETVRYYRWAGKQRDPLLL